MMSIERKIAKNSSLFWCVITAFSVAQLLIIFTFHTTSSSSGGGYNDEYATGRHQHHRQALAPTLLNSQQQQQPSGIRRQQQQQQQQQQQKPTTQMTSRQRNPQQSTSTNTAIDRSDLQAARDYANSFTSFGKGPLNFFHVPKTAGTAVEEAAAKHAKIPWGSCRFYHKPKRDICPYPSGPDWPRYVGWWHLPAYLFPLVGSNPYQSTELFAIVRDPYDRMVSEFYYICTLKVKGWRPDQCDNRTRLFDPSYMNDWLTKKLRGRESQTAQGFLADNSHFTPQHEFLVGPHQVRVVDYVLRMDDPDWPLAEQFDRLMAAFGMSADIKLAHMGAISAGERNTTEHLTTDNLHPSTLDWIHRQYPDDFDRLGYARLEITR